MEMESRGLVLRLVVLLSVSLSGVAVARAQDGAVADTLDWRLYYPLEIGNAWEYVDDNWPITTYPKYIHHQVDRDSLVGQHSYFFVQRLYHDTETNNTIASESLLRYDDSLRAVVQLSKWDSTENSLAFGCSFAVPFPSGDYGHVVPCDSTSGTEVLVYGGYADFHLPIGNDSIHVKAEKMFCQHGPCVAFAYGVGDVGGPSEGGQNTISLEYAHIGGTEYGKTVLLRSAEEEPVSRALSLTSVFPNPFHGQLVIVFSAAAAEVVRVSAHDVLGRRLWATQMTGTASGVQEMTVDARTWPSGIYFIQVEGEFGRSHTKTATLIN